MTGTSQSPDPFAVKKTNELGVSPDAPWLGLRSFTESVRNYFYGRDAEIQELFERVQHRTLTVLFGQSGLGKTSLLRAGLIPRLREAHYTPVLIRLVHDEAAEPLERQVIRAITKSWPASIAPPQSNSLWELFHDPRCGMIGSGPRNVGVVPQHPVLILDQFEELFTLGEAKRPSDAKDFLEALACLVENRPPSAIRAAMDRDDALADRLQLGPQPCKVLIALRDDFLHRLERGRRQMPSMMDNRLELRLLSGTQAYRAVYEPGNKRPNRPIVAAETAQAIVRFVAKASSDTPLEEIDNVPPLLSLICEQLNARRLAEKEPMIRAESLAQSAPEVLRNYYEQTFASHPSAIRIFVEDELVSASGFRESKTLDTAKTVLSQAGVTDPERALRELVDQRLLVIEDRGGVARVELTHDILAPIAASARYERAEREAKAAAEQRLIEEQKKRRLFMAVTGLMASLLIAAILSGLFAWNKAQEAEIQFTRANAQATAAKEAEVRAKSALETADAATKKHLITLRQASIADHASAKKALTEDFNAETKGVLSESLVNKTKWHEAVALLVRALELDPSNQEARLRLYHTFAMSGRKKAGLPVHRLTHAGTVHYARFSSGGTRIVSASSDNTAQVWDMATGLPVGEPLRHAGFVTDATFSPDDTRIVTASWDNSAQIWDAVTGTPVGEPLRHEGHVAHARFSTDGRRIVTASWDNSARVWDAATGAPLGEPLRHSGSVTDASFSPDGSQIVTASWDNTARVWDAATGIPVSEPLQHEAYVTEASFSPDGTQVITASWDDAARVWDAATSRLFGEPLRHLGHVKHASFSPDGTRIVTASSDQTARVWDAATGTAVSESLSHSGPVNHASFSLDGRRIVTVSGDNTARVWDTATGTPVGEPLRHESEVYHASFSENGAWIITASDDNSARVWDAATGTPVGEPLRHGSGVLDARFSPDGNRIVTASWDATTRIWDAATGTSVVEPLGQASFVRVARFSPNGRWIITASEDYTARVWDVAAGTQIGEPIRHENSVADASFSPDGTRIVTASWDKTARVWDAATGTPVGKPLRHANAVNHANFSQDGTQIVTASDDHTAQVWDAATGTSVGEPLQQESTVTDASFSPDAGRIVTVSGDDTVRVWSVATGTPLGEPLRHASAVNHARFSPDGRRIVTASDDKTARLWDAATGSPVGGPLRHLDAVTDANFSRDSMQIITASVDATARVWNVGEPSDLFGQAEISPEILEWATCVAGMRFNNQGELTVIPDQERMSGIAQTHLPSGCWADLASWLNASGPNKTNFPNSKTTVRQIAERERDYGSIASLESAIGLDPALPLTRLMLANLSDRQELKKVEDARDNPIFARDAHLRRYELDRLPNDPNIMRRAAKILLDLPDAKVGAALRVSTASQEAEILAKRILEIEPATADQPKK